MFLFQCDIMITVEVYMRIKHLCHQGIRIWGHKWFLWYLCYMLECECAACTHLHLIQYSVIVNIQKWYITDILFNKKYANVQIPSYFRFPRFWFCFLKTTMRAIWALQHVSNVFEDLYLLPSILKSKFYVHIHCIYHHIHISSCLASHYGWYYN